MSLALPASLPTAILFFFSFTQNKEGGAGPPEPSLGPPLQSNKSQKVKPKKELSLRRGFETFPFTAVSRFEYVLRSIIITFDFQFVRCLETLILGQLSKIRATINNIREIDNASESAHKRLSMLNVNEGEVTQQSFGFHVSLLCS